MHGTSVADSTWCMHGTSVADSTHETST